MRYIKLLCKPLKKIKLKEWENFIIDSMMITPFFVLQEKNTKYYLAYIDDDAPLDVFNKQYLDIMKIEELNIESVINILIKQSSSYFPTADEHGFINIIIKNKNKYSNKNEKPYQSWLWNDIHQRWQAPFDHPYQYEGEFVWDQDLKKWIENPKYLSYIWNEEQKIWQYTPNDDNVVI